MPPTTAPPAASPASPPPTAEATAPTIVVANSDSAHTQVSGTGTPRASLRVLDPQNPATSLCTTTVATDGSWSCLVAVSSGAGQVLVVRDLTNSGFGDVTSAPFSVLTAPVLSTATGVAVGARVNGTGYPGAVVSLTLKPAISSRAVVVTANVASDSTWMVTLPAGRVPSGSYRVSATQSSAAVPAVPKSSSSATLTITIDRTAPAAPVLEHPVAGSTISSQPLTFDGTGENGAIVTTYVDSNPVCAAKVTSGRWSCTSAGLLLPAGTRTVQAAQRDTAGNYGAPSAGFSVIFTSNPSKTPSAPSSAVPAPSQGTSPSTTPSGGATTPPPPTGNDGGGSGSSGSGSGSAPGAGQAPAGGYPGDAVGAAAGSWTAATTFGRNLPTFSESIGSWAWVWALVLGLVFILLVVAPLRLAATALGGRIAVRARRFTGRGHTRHEREAPLFSPRTSVAVALAAGAILVALAIGVDDQVRYVRLIIGIIIGIGIVNGLGIVLPTWIAGRRLGLGLRIRVSPAMLALAGVACLVTRIFDLDPPMVLGVLVVAGLVDSSGRGLEERRDARSSGILAAVQLTSLAVVSLLAWVGHGMLSASGTVFAVEITREMLTTVCVSGLGSLVILLVPVGALPGRALYAWSRPTLVGLVVAGVAVAAVVFAGGPNEAFPVVPLVIGAIVFAVVAVSAWVWVTYVEPELDEAY
ncbi:MAG: hypothetical protein JWP75_3483 [Frondihabitans sp.]|nr:hypothetical protein [Frondihabitans sp.]